MENLARQRVVADSEIELNISEMENGEGSQKPKKRGRGLIINAKLARMKAKGKPLDIKFPKPFGKVCGKHAKLFKSEVTVCVRQLAPLKVDNWKKISEDDIKIMWRFLKERLSLSEDDCDDAMRQVRRQYQIRLYNLYKAYRQKKACPRHVDPEDWRWLIRNKWSTKGFKLNRGKQEMKSITGTKSIVQKAYEMKKPESEEWPSAMDVWKATRMRPNGTWSTPNDETTLKKLEDVGDLYKEETSNATVPLVEHFALVLGRKRNHSLGVGVGAISIKAQEKQFIHAQLEAEKKKSQALQVEVDKLTEVTRKQDEAYSQLQVRMESQQAEMEQQRKALETQTTEMPQKIQDEVQRQMSIIFARIASEKSTINLLAAASENIEKNN